MTDRLLKHYGAFTPAERARLVIEATARGDLRERDRLVGACRTKVYTETDAEFVSLVGASRMVALSLSAELGRWVGQLEVATTLEEAVWDTPGRMLAAEHPRERLHAGLVVYAINRAAEAIKGWLEGFQGLCRHQLGVESDVVLQAHVPGLRAMLKAHREVIESAPSGPDDVARKAHQLEDVWRRALAASLGGP